MSADEKFILTTDDIAQKSRDALLKLFPEICTEGTLIDFDRLRLSLLAMQWTWAKKGTG